MKCWIQTDDIEINCFKFIKPFLTFIIILISIFFHSKSFAQGQKDDDLLMLTEWNRGIKLQSRNDTAGYAYLRFYEWNLFNAVKEGEHTPGSESWKWIINDHHTLAQMDAQWLMLSIKATENGADMFLHITNAMDYDWPEIAAIIPCLNPGGANSETQVKRNPIFLDEKHENTFFLGSAGLELLNGQYPREIHFAHEFRPEIMTWKKELQNGNFVFSNKWPTSKQDAYAGLMVRESSDHKWVMGIAWESFLSAQGHNPWNCMHLSIKVGPLNKGQTKTIRGKIYLFQGTKEDCLTLFKNDFQTNA